MPRRRGAPPRRGERDDHSSGPDGTEHAGPGRSGGSGSSRGGSSSDRRGGDDTPHTPSDRPRDTGRRSTSTYVPGEPAKDLDSLSQAIQRARAGTDEIARVLKVSTFRPGAPAFTTLIKSCCRLGAWEKACELYVCMKARGVAANTITCSALINACGKSRQWEKALEIFSEMKKDGVEANIFTYSALISACAKGKRLDKALEMFEACQNAGVEQDSITYGAVISA